MLYSGFNIPQLLVGILRVPSEASDMPMAELVRGLLIPEGHYNGGSAFPEQVDFPIGQQAPAD